MRVTMVKKRLKSGEPCPKCVQAEELLKRRGLWEKIDEVVWATEGEPESPGMQLAGRFNVELAPFFVVQREADGEQVYESVIKLMQLFEPNATTAPRPAGALDLERLVRT